MELLVWTLFVWYWAQDPETGKVKEELYTLAMEGPNECQKLAKRLPEGASQHPIAHGAKAECRQVKIVLPD